MPIFEGLDVELAAPEHADLVVCSGLFDDDIETPDDYAELLRDLAERKFPMICANPDHMVERGNRLVYCAGALAAVYEDLGGEVVYAGKPHAPVYRPRPRDHLQASPGATSARTRCWPLATA